MRRKFSKVFLHKLHLKCIQNVKIAVIKAVIKDNKNSAPSLFRSLCEFVGNCFGPRYFSSGAALPQKNTSVQNNHLRFYTMTSKKMVRSYYCLINAYRVYTYSGIQLLPRYTKTLMKTSHIFASTNTQANLIYDPS